MPKYLDKSNVQQYLARTGYLDNPAHIKQYHLENFKEAETKQTVNKNPAVKAFKQPLHLRFAGEQAMTLGAQILT